MRLLLDTHALIWAVQSPERLSRRALAALTTDSAEVYASHASLWEMAIKRGFGRLGGLDRTAGDWFEHFVPRSGFRPLPITVSHLAAVEELPRLHHDPFDRLLVVQAGEGAMALITADSHITQYDVDVIW